MAVGKGNSHAWNWQSQKSTNWGTASWSWRSLVSTTIFLINAKSMSHFSYKLFSLFFFFLLFSLVFGVSRFKDMNLSSAVPRFRILVDFHHSTVPRIRVVLMMITDNSWKRECWHWHLIKQFYNEKATYQSHIWWRTLCTVIHGTHRYLHQTLWYRL